MKRGRPQKLGNDSRAVGFRLPLEMWEKIRVMADADERPIGVIVRRLLAVALENPANRKK